MRIPYKHIAAALAAAQPTRQFASDAGAFNAATYAWKEATLNVTDVLAAANPKFDRRRFLTAAGVLSAEKEKVA